MSAGIAGWAHPSKNPRTFSRREAYIAYLLGRQVSEAHSSTGCENPACKKEYERLNKGTG